MTETDFEIGVGVASAPPNEEVTAIVRGFDPASTGLPLDLVPKLLNEKKKHLGPASGVDPQKLSSAGWGVLFAFDEKQENIDALRPLLDWRKSQAGDLYREYVGATGYKGQTKEEFLKDAGGFGPVDPAKNGIPYYLLFVGSPKQIPYHFQYLIDVQYGVGRIHFDTAAEYRLYAENVVAAEKNKLVLRRKAAFLGTANQNDSPTAASRVGLIEPLQKYVKDNEWWGEEIKTEQKVTWEVDCPPAAEVTRAGLLAKVSDAPALVMVASHGMDLSNEPKELTEEQRKKLEINRRRYNGALLGQDHVFAANSPLLLESFVAAKDVPETARLHGSVFLLFACFGGGTPQIEDFKKANSEKRQIAEEAFLAALPKRLLTGGALAVIAHVERAWTTSFKSKRGLVQLQTFRDTLRELLLGSPVGFAMEAFNLKWAELATSLVSEIDLDKNNPNTKNKPDSGPLRSYWEAMNDTRNFCVIGDPAVRLVTGDVESGPVEIERNAVSEKIQEQPVTADAEQKPEVMEPMAFSSPIITMDLAGHNPEQAKASTGTLDSLMEEIKNAMESAFRGLTEVEVLTYVSDNVENVVYKDRSYSGAKLRARTEFGINGKMENLVPMKDGKMDEALWAVHLASVDKAVANRNEMLKLAATAASSLLTAVKGK